MHFRLIMVNYVVKQRNNPEFAKGLTKISQNIQFCEILLNKMGSRIQSYAAKHHM